MDFIAARDLIASTPPFAGMAPEEKGLLLLTAHQLDYNPGDVVYARGDKGAQTFMFIIEGELEIVADGEDKVIAKLGPGALVGEGAHLTKSHERTKTVRAGKRTSVLYWVADEVRETDETMWDFLIEKFQEVVSKRTARR